MKNFKLLLILVFAINALAMEEDPTADNTPCDAGQETTVCGETAEGETVCGSATCPQ